jgi:site-specific DNA-cytosine methylase
MKIRAIDLCAGAGGWACAANGLPIEIVAAVDYWEPACKTYALNHEWTKVTQDDLRLGEAQDRLLEWLRANVPAGPGAGEFGIDLILGGIPCEWLSIRRNVGNAVGQGELDDQRKTLRAVLDLVKKIAPRWWCLEDVKGLVAELPAGTPWIELDAADYSPQRRKRIYVGNFPRPAGTGPLLDPRSTEVLRDRLRPGPYRIGRRSHGRQFVTSDAFDPGKAYVAYPVNKCPTICSLSSRHDPEFLVADGWLPGGARQLEWQEAALLQGFPDDYLFYGSPSDVGIQIGRAVQIDTARVILRGIVRQWEELRP